MENPEKKSATQLLHKTLDTFFAKDMKGLSDLFADDIVAEFPFAPEGSPARFEGKEDFYAYLKDYPSFIDIKTRPTMKIYGTEDANLAIAEWSAKGVVIGNGNPYEMSYATFATFKDGLISNYREYWNPQAFTKAMGGGDFAGE